MAEPIRTFVAIELDDALRRKIADARAQLERTRAVKWGAVDNIHITLKFLGDVDAAAMPALEQALAAACQATPPFALTLRGIGAFPNTQRPNVVWIGAEGQIDAMLTLAKKIDAACAVLGFARDERPFTPHLTIGRVKRDASPNDRKNIGALIERAQVGALGELKVEQISVMKSALRPAGSVYTRLAQIQLTNDERRLAE